MLWSSDRLDFINMYPLRFPLLIVVFLINYTRGGGQVPKLEIRTPVIKIIFLATYLEYFNVFVSLVKV